MSSHNKHLKIAAAMLPAATDTPVRLINLEDGLGCLLAYGNALPSSAAGYAKGCIFILTDGGANTTFNVNEGTVASSTFLAIVTD